MGILVKVGGALQRLFGEIAETAATESGVIQRRRKFTAVSLARTFVLGFLQTPTASDEKLAQMAVQCGVAVTPQAIEQRHTPRLVDFLERLFRGATSWSSARTRPWRRSWNGSPPSRCWTVRRSLARRACRSEFRGCGGSYDSGTSALKLQTELDLRSGALAQWRSSLAAVPMARRADKRRDAARDRCGSPTWVTSVGRVRRDDGGGRVFSVAFAVRHPRAAASRDKAVEVLGWLANSLARSSIDCVGQEQRLPCRLIAWRLPQEQANRRRRKLRQETRKKEGGTQRGTLGLVRLDDPGDERAGRTLDAPGSDGVVSCPLASGVALQTLEITGIGGRTERLDRRSPNGAGVVTSAGGSHPALVDGRHHLGRPQPEPGQSVASGATFRRPLGRQPGSRGELQRVLADMRATFAKTCRRNKRSKPGTFELLNDVELLDFELT